MQAECQSAPTRMSAWQAGKPAPRCPGQEALPGIRLDGVVAFAGLGLEILVGELDVEFAIAAVLGVVERSVANGVLAAHFLVQLSEDDLEAVLAVDPVDVAAGVVGHTVEGRPAGIP